MISEGARVVRGRLVHPRVQLFPGYVFVRPLDEGRWRFLSGTRGVAQLILFGQNPATIPEVEIEKLRRRENEDGLVELPQPPRFTVGATVRVVNGAFAGCIGIYAGMAADRRQEVLLEMLGRRVSILVADAAITDA